MTAGVPRYASVHDDVLVFVADDDVWSAPVTGGRATRVTAGDGTVTHARISPDGRQIAFTGADHGVREVYVVEVHGGEIRRLTWQGDHARVLGWSPEGEVVFTSAWQRPFVNDLHLYVVSPEGGLVRPLSLGPATGISWRHDGRVALGRFQEDLSRWKRYRGGRVGVLWVEDDAGSYQRLELPGGAVNPMWVGDRLFFVGDGSGDAQLCSCEADGSDLRRHSDHQDGFSVRFAATDGQRLVYCQGSGLWQTTSDATEPTRIDVQVPTPRTWRQRRFVGAARYLEDVDVHPDGHSLLTTTRGRPFHLGHWEGPARQLGQRDGVRYRLARWLDGDRVLVVSDAGGEEALEIHPVEGGPPSRLDALDLGRIVELVVCPSGRRAAAANHRQELWLVDLERGSAELVDHSTCGRISGLDWSGDARWLAWSQPCGERGYRSRIRAIDVEVPGPPHDLTDGRYRDLQPSFDPAGEHLYFLSHREFAPVYDAHYFQIGFPQGARPYLITLRRDTPSPFEPSPRPLKRPRKSHKDDPVDVHIDLDDIQARIVPFPIKEGRFEAVVGVGDGKVLLTRAPMRSGRVRWNDQGPPPSDLHLLQFELDTAELLLLNARVSQVFVGRARDTLAIRSGWRLRVAPARPDKSQRDDLRRTEGATTRKGGFVDLGRIRVSIDQAAEWRQMLREVWRLMRDQFWSADMGGVDWGDVYARYSAQLPQVSSRSEFSDLVWRMQGELGTSHAYETGGEYPRVATYRVGALGADVSWEPEAPGWRIDRVVRGEPGVTGQCSPLLAPGVGLAEGDVLTEIAGEPARSDAPLELALVHEAGTLVDLAVHTATGSRRVVVRTLRTERPLRYRDWVVRNRELVHEASAGRVGYVHVPDMGPDGYATFHRDYLAESECDGLIVDVRFNRGGHVSQLLLDKLTRRRVGHAVTRWSAPRPYPAHTVAGPMVCLTNEMAGSDGDIFSHVWKLHALGPLVGTRTWGGVVGIYPRQRLVDRAVPTQPEFANWFEDVGFGLENHGTQPDVVVHAAPDAYARGDDPQLIAALELAVAGLDAPTGDQGEFEGGGGVKPVT